MTRAIPMRREKVIDEQGNIVELAIWKVPPTRQNVAGIRYRLAFVRRDEGIPAVLYDCHPPQGITATWRGSRSRTTSWTSTSSSWISPPT